MRKQDKGAGTKWDLFYGILIGHKQGEAKLRGLKEGLNGPPVTEGGLLSRLQGHSIAVSGELFFFFFCWVELPRIWSEGKRNLTFWRTWLKSMWNLKEASRF